MRRREFIAVVSAQQPTMSVIGFLSGSSLKSVSNEISAFQDGLKEAGFLDGRNVRIEYRWAEQHYDQLSALANELNTCIKSLCWGFELQSLTWPFVELTRHFVQMSLRVHRQVGSLQKLKCCVDRLSRQSLADIARYPADVRFTPERWGNRPALLWIGEDFGCCASG
jgi:hypothetical protein